MSGQFVYDRAPARVYWEITRACDLACRHCRAEAAPEPDPEELTTEEGLRLLGRIAAFGAPMPHIVLTGGDPLKRGDVFGLIEAARSLGLGVSLSPSGTPLLTPAVIERIKRVGVEAISLSLDGATAAAHDAVRGVPGCFDRTIAAAAAAVAADLPFQVNTLVARETLGEIPAIHDLVRQIRATRWSLFFLVTVGRGTVLAPIDASACENLFGWLADRAGDGAPVITTTEAPHFRRVLMERARGGPRRPGRPPGGHGAGVRDGNGIMFVGHTGDVYPSGFLPVVTGNVRTDDPVRIYQESATFRILRQPDLFRGRCGVCEFRGPCGGSRSRAFAATGDLLAEDPLCAYRPRAWGRGTAATAGEPVPDGALA